jgi:phosphoribosyl-dephospho-CoA transferase
MDITIKLLLRKTTVVDKKIEKNAPLEELMDIDTLVSDVESSERNLK